MRPIAIANPPNPWAKTSVDYLGEPPSTGLLVFHDQTREILSKNDSPDLDFTWSVNPYRGCLHGCAYCYARPSHEYLSFGSGSDFERKIVVKPNAPELLRQALRRASWKGEQILFSGNTDCYQPLEASYGLTRKCLEVCLERRNPVAVITKSPLIERDIEVLTQLSAVADLGISISIPFWNERHARAIEPFVTTPARRMKTVERLAAAGLAVNVNVAPVIPGLNDQDIVAVLEAAKRAGAQSAAMILVRLPASVKQVFEERVRAALPERAERILARVRETRGGALNDPRFGSRMRGEGVYADIVTRLFESTRDRLGLAPASMGTGKPAPTETSPTNERPTARREEDKQRRQLPLFDR